VPESGRDVVIPDGLIAIDKPAGPTSHDLVDEVRRLAGIKRVGHTGTLDPGASGLLLVCLGRATRLVRFLQRGTKVYEGSLTLGITTDTLDSFGAETGRSPCNAGPDDVIFAMRSLTGLIPQTPPMASALKVGGRKLYELARKGEVVRREARPVRVDRFELRAFDDGEYPVVRFEVACGAGTYIRSLAADLGARLGCGAYLSALRRTANGPYTLDDAYTLDELRRMAAEGRLEETLVPLSSVKLDLPVLALGEDARRRVSHGALLSSEEYPELSEVGCDGEFEVRDEERLLAIYRVTCTDESVSARAEVVLSPAREENAS